MRNHQGTIWCPTPPPRNEETDYSLRMWSGTTPTSSSSAAIGDRADIGRVTQPALQISQSVYADGWTNNNVDARAIVLRTTLQIFTNKPQPEPLPYSTTGRTILFFDGDSRGNPGPSGSGAALIRLDTDGIGASIAWAGSASFVSPLTTNNYAEYQDLIWDLAVAARHHVGRIHVMGDSAMILRQLRSNTPPRSVKLRTLYAHARLIADSWQHHYRAHNKMADYLANQAMDSRRSAQGLFPIAHTQLIGAQDFLANAIGHWASNPPTLHTLDTRAQTLGL